jgi:hypothetical protein
MIKTMHGIGFLLNVESNVENNAGSNDKSDINILGVNNDE